MIIRRRSWTLCEPLTTGHSTSFGPTVHDVAASEGAGSLSVSLRLTIRCASRRETGWRARRTKASSWVRQCPQYFRRWRNGRGLTAHTGCICRSSHPAVLGIVVSTDTSVVRGPNSRRCACRCRRACLSRCNHRPHPLSQSAVSLSDHLARNRTRASHRARGEGTSTRPSLRRRCNTNPDELAPDPVAGEAQLGSRTDLLQRT